MVKCKCCGADMNITETMITKNGYGEHHVLAYNASGKRIPDADYFTNDKQDAEATAKLMVNPVPKKG